MTQQPGPALAVALVALLLLAVAASFIGGLRRERQLATAAVRAAVQLTAVSLIIAAVLSHLAWSLLFGAFMIIVATITSARRIGAGSAWPLVGLAIAAGVLPTLSVIFTSGAVPFTGASIVPVTGIIIGGAMTASSLCGRRIFTALRDERGEYEAGLSLGLPRAAAIGEVIGRHLPEALVPGLDQTRTVGLVTLPGAFVGVLLGGGTPVQAGAAQLLVLIGLLATQTITVVVMSRLVRGGRLLPNDLRRSLPV
ncbi:MAG TPA: ABC transporter permease [Microlunatus sp.]|nr:ABC transporter permease [Microlunatus sp.]